MVNKRPKRRFSMFRPRVLSRHPSHRPLRGTLPLLPFRSVVRFGSTTQCFDDVTSGGARIECNTVEAVRNSASKRRMKKCFTDAGLPTAMWWTSTTAPTTIEFPIVAKHIFGSRGTGNYLIKSQEALNRWLRDRELKNYIFEKFYNFNREYRLHVTEEGCFYTCRKMLKDGVPEEDRWQRHSDNCVWVVEENPEFDKPVNWAAVVSSCVAALKAVKLDIGCFDVKIQSATDSKGRKREAPEFIILESGSAPAFGEITEERYRTMIPRILTKKYEKFRNRV